MSKYSKVCDYCCLYCKYPDCVNDSLTRADRDRQDAYDKWILKERKSTHIHISKGMYTYIAICKK